MTGLFAPALPLIPMSADVSMLLTFACVCALLALLCGVFAVISFRAQPRYKRKGK